MTQQFTNLGQRSALTKHPGGEGMAKQMRSLMWRINAGPPEGVPDH